MRERASTPPGEGRWESPTHFCLPKAQPLSDPPATPRVIFAAHGNRNFQGMPLPFGPLSQPLIQKTISIKVEVLMVFTQE